MAYEIIRKNLHALQDNHISVTKSNICFGRDFTQYFKDKSYVEVYTDKDTGKIGFNPTNNRITGFKVKLEDETGRIRFTFARVSKLLVSGKYSGTWEMGIIGDDTKTGIIEAKLIVQ